MRFSQFSVQQMKLYVLHTKTQTRGILFRNEGRISEGLLSVRGNSAKVNGQMGDFRNQIGNLSAAEKLELLDVLWESLEDDPPLTDVQRAELDYRVARYEQNPAGVIPWDQVRAGLSKKQ